MGLIKEDLIFGRIAVLNNIISREQLDEAISIQQKREIFSPLSMILLEKGYISREHLRAILEAQKKKLPKPAITTQEKREDMVFAYLTAKKDYTDEKAIYECLMIQNKLAKKGLLFRVSEVLVNQRYLNLAQAEEVLEEQERRIIPCPGCSTQYNTIGMQSATFVCRKCGFTLAIPEEFVASDESEEIENFRISLESIAQAEAAPRLDVVRPSVASTKSYRRSRAGRSGESLRIIHDRFTEEDDGLAQTRDEDNLVEDDLEITHGVSETREEEEFFEEEMDEFITLGVLGAKELRVHKYDDETVWHRSIIDAEGTTSSEDLMEDDSWEKEEIIAVGGINLAQQMQKRALQDQEAGLVASAGEDYIDLAEASEYVELGGDDYVDLAEDDYVDLAEDDYVDLAEASDYLDLADADDYIEVADDYDDTSGLTEDSDYIDLLSSDGWSGTSRPQAGEKGTANKATQCKEKILKQDKES